MLQIYTSTVQIGGSNGTRYGSVWIARSQGVTTLNQTEHVMPAAGTIRNLRVRHSVALTGAMQIVVALMVNGAASALTVTLDSANQEATDVANDVAVSAGDTIAWREVSTNTPTSGTARFSFEFEPTDANKSVYGYGNNNVPLGTAPTRDALLFGGVNGGITWASDATDTQDVIAQPGTIVAHRVQLDNTPGVGTSRTFTIHLNGVAQDGTAGTPDTRVTIAAGSTSGSATFSLTVAAGDLVYVRHTVSGSPSTAHRANGTIAFVSDDDDRWNYGGTSINNPASGTTQYNYPNGNAAAYTGTETDRQHKNGPTTFYLSALRVRAATAPGAGNTYDYSLRQGAAGTTQTVQMADANTTAGPSAGAAVLVADGGLVAFESVPASTPTQPGSHSWCFVASNADPAAATGGGPLAGRGRLVGGRGWLAGGRLVA